jgi:hypothetical protein
VRTFKIGRVRLGHMCDVDDSGTETNPLSFLSKMETQAATALLTRALCSGCRRRGSLRMRRSAAPSCRLVQAPMDSLPQPRGGVHVKRGTPMITPAARSVAEASGQRFVARLEVTRDHPLSRPRYRRHIEIACEITQEA